MGFHSLPIDNSLDRSKFKAYADDKINVTYNQKLCLGSVKNNVEKGENADYHHFLLYFSHNVFQKASVSGSFKVMIVW